MVFPSAENLSVQLPRNSKFCSAVRLRSLLQKSTPATVLEGGFHTSGTAGSLVERKFIQSLVSIAALMQPIKDGLSQQLRSVLMNHLLPLPLANEDQVRRARQPSPSQAFTRVILLCTHVRVPTRHAMVPPVEQVSATEVLVCCPTLGSRWTTYPGMFVGCAAPPLHLLLR